MVAGLGLGGTLAPLGLPASRSFVTPGHTTYDETLTGGIGTHPTDVAVRAVPTTLTQAVATASALIVAQAPIARDELGVTYLVTPVRGHTVTLTQGMGIGSALALIRGVVLLEQLRIVFAQVPNSKSRVSTTEELGVDELLLQARPVLLTSGVGIALTQQAVLSLQILEELGLLATLAPLLKYGQRMTEAVGIAADLSRFLGASLNQGIGAGSTLAGVGAKSVTLSQGVGMAQAQTPTLLLRVTTTEDIGLDDINVLRMIFKPVLSQGLEITAAYLSPGDSITTWAMNTRTAAVTEYSNYAFNSFARIGDKYIGASADGLYELLGDNDDGTDIVAQIKSGFAQWAGTRFTLFKAAYLGVRGEGDFVLRLITGEGQTYDYSVSTRDMRSTKVHMGKGLRARYFAFELISTGQDFDLESIEFVPLVADRRV
jgi:hypothetical protein